MRVPAAGWTPAYDGHGKVRTGAWVADISGMPDLDAWPAGMRVIVRKERPHPGTQLRFTDIDGHRFTLSPPTPRKASSLTWNCGTGAGHAARIRVAKDTGLRNLPLKGYPHNQVWCEVVALACELLAWTQLLALTGTARRWEPKRLRLRVFAVAGRLARNGRRRRLRLAERWPRGRPDHRRGYPPTSPPVRLTSRNSRYDQEDIPGA